MFIPFRSHVYTAQIVLTPQPPIFQASPIEATKQIDTINILDILSCSGYCEIVGDRICVYVLARDIAIGGGLDFDDNKVSATGGRNTYESIRWNRFKEYFDRVIEEFRRSTPEILPYIQPLDINSYILLEVALGILNQCRNDKAVQFRGKLMTQAAIWIRDEAMAEYNIRLRELQRQIDAQCRTLLYQESYLNTKGLFASTVLAKKYNMSAQIFHRILQKAGYIFKHAGMYLMKSPYDRIGLMKIVDLQSPAGITTVSMWTESGRNFVHDVFLSLGIEENKDNNKIIKKFLEG